MSDLKLVWSVQVVRDYDNFSVHQQIKLAEARASTPAEALSRLREIVREKHDDSMTQLDLIEAQS